MVDSGGVEALLAFMRSCNRWGAYSVKGEGPLVMAVLI
jgi:hypothetical protein